MTPSGQITVDANALDNGSWRRLIGQNVYTEVRDGSRQTVFLFREFVVNGSTPTEAMARWNETVADFSRSNAAIVATVDDTSSEVLADLSAFSNGNMGNSCSVEMTDEYFQTATSFRGLFKAQADRALESGAAEPGATFPGQDGPIVVSTSRSEGRIEARSVVGAFNTVFVDGSAGSVTVTDIVNAAGKAKFDTADVLPAFSAGMRIRVTGTAGYDGWHSVTAIGAGGITTATDFVAGETGLAAGCQIGEVISGQQNFDNAYGSILSDILETGSGGARNDTTGLALAEENISRVAGGDNRVEFLMSAAYIPLAMPLGDLNNNVRSLEMTISGSEQQWDMHGGERPYVATLSVSFACVDSQVSAANRWRSMRETALAEARRQTGRSDLVFVEEAVTYSPNTREASVVASCRSGSPVNVAYKRIVRYEENPVHLEWRDGPYKYAQRPDGPPDRRLTYTISRVGEGEVDLTPDTPNDFGETWIRGPKISESSTIVTPSGLVLFEQSMTVTFTPITPRNGQSAKVVGPGVYRPITGT